MRISCPFCGERSSREFICHGEAAAARPDAEDELFGHLYLRDNPAGPLEEHWYHAQGCRRWLRVTRDTRTHAILGTRMAGEADR